jgi:hypothetical protein
MGERTRARDPNFSWAHFNVDCCSPVVGLSLTARRVAANVAKLPELLRK